MFKQSKEEGFWYCSLKQRIKVAISACSCYIAFCCHTAYWTIKCYLYLWTLQTTSVPVCPDLSQKVTAKEHYSVHSAIFVIAHMVLGGSGRGSCVWSNFPFHRGPQAQGRHCGDQHLHTVTAGRRHTNTVQCGKKIKWWDSSVFACVASPLCSVINGTLSCPPISIHTNTSRWKQPALCPYTVSVYPCLQSMCNHLFNVKFCTYIQGLCHYPNVALPGWSV